MMNLTGHVYGRLTVLRRAENTKANKTRWLCSCSCGNTTTVISASLRTRATQSCGCLWAEKISSQGGRCSDPAFLPWKSMVARCANPKHVSYHYYGAKGIAVYEPWVFDFQKFKSYVGPRPTPKHSIDRIDNAKGYEPGNVRWATDIEQLANRKNTAMVDYQGVKQPLALLARAHGLDPQLVNKRVFQCGWTIEKALTTPVRQRPAVSAPFGADTAP